MAATVEELKELAKLARESGDEALEEKALTQLLALQESANAESQGIQAITPEAIAQSMTNTDVGGQLSGVANEFASGANRKILGIIDSLGPDRVNDIFQMAGYGRPIEPLQSSLSGSVAPPQGTYSDTPLGRIAGTAGGAGVEGVAGGTVLRGLAATLPAVTNTAGGVLKSMAASAPSVDALYGGIAGGAGQTAKEAGAGEGGQMAASILAPLAAPALASAAKTAAKWTWSQLVSGLTKGEPQAVAALKQRIKDEPFETAVIQIRDALQRENIDADELVKRMGKGGDDAIIADYGDDLRTTLRAAANISPSTAGEARKTLMERAKAGHKRVSSTVDDYLGTKTLDVDAEIQRLQDENFPVYDALYKTAKQESKAFKKPESETFSYTMGKGKPRAETLSDKIIKQFESDSTKDGVIPAKAMNRARTELAAMKANGDEITPLDIVDANKRALDDLIEAEMTNGQEFSNLGRLYVGIKHRLVADADKQFKYYKDARGKFAEQAGLEKAARIGESFNRMKPRDIKYYSQTFSDQELAMAKLGMKRAIMDQIDSLKGNADAARRLFGSEGSVMKMRPLYKNGAEFAKFTRMLKNEAEYKITQEAVVGNSTTAGQTQSVQAMKDSAKATLLISKIKNFSLDPRAWYKGATTNAETKRIQEVAKETGKLLLASGEDRKKVISMIKNKELGEMQKALQKLVIEQKDTGRAARAVQGIIAAENQ